MELQVVVLVSLKKRVLAATEGDYQEFQKLEEVVQFFQALQGQEVVLLGVMGGQYQSLFSRVAQLGIPVWRIPMFRLQELTGLTVRASSKKRAEAIRQAWRVKPDYFYPMRPLERTVSLLRQLTRFRKDIQDTFRKPAQLQFLSALREIQFILPSGAEEVVEIIKEAAKGLFRKQKLQDKLKEALQGLESVLLKEEKKEILPITQSFANPRFIIGAKEDEEGLKAQIKSLVKTHPLWKCFHPPKNSALPPIKGMGSVLVGSILGEIGDIRRFSSPKNFRAYARFHLIEGKFPKRVAGKLSSWNSHLHNVLWLWANEQMPKYKHLWRSLYLWRKAKEIQAHPEVKSRIIEDKQGRSRIIYDYTLRHLDSRAKRWVGSQLLNYLWDLWQKLECNEDLEFWYSNSSWPIYFKRVEKELKDGLMEFLKAEILKRQRNAPELGEARLKEI